MAFFRDVHEDIQTVLKKDPAARNSIEVLLCYPGVWALIFHKPAHSLYKHKVKLLARIISQFARWLTGVEIHPGCDHRPQVFYRPRDGGGHRRDDRNRRRCNPVSGCHFGRHGKRYWKAASYHREQSDCQFRGESPRSV